MVYAIVMMIRKTITFNNE